MRLAALLALASCHVSPEAAWLRLEERHTQGCIQASVGVRQCLQCQAESKARCLDAGRDPGCGVDHFENNRSCPYFPASPLMGGSK